MTLRVEAAYREAFQAAGLQTVADVLDRAVCIRDLPDRSNHELDVGGQRVFVKRSKPRWLRRVQAAPEAAGIRRVRAVGVRTAALVCEGTDAKAGALTGTLDLAPRAPLDAVVHAGGLGYAARRSVTFDFARQVAALHAAALHHRDLYLNHWFVDATAAYPTGVLIDCERVASHRGAFSRWVVKDLAALDSSAVRAGLSRASRYRFFLAYLSARGESVDLAIKHVLPRVRAKAARMLRHQPQTPVGIDARPSS